MEQAGLRAGVHLDLQGVIVSPRDIQPAWNAETAARRIDSARIRRGRSRLDATSAGRSTAAASASTPAASTAATSTARDA